MTEVEQSRSESKIALSTSPHWRSSIARMSGVPIAEPFQKLAQPGEGAAPQLLLVGHLRRLPARRPTASTLCKTGNTRARNVTSCGSRLSVSRVGSPFRYRARASIKLSSAL